MYEQNGYTYGWCRYKAKRKSNYDEFIQNMKQRYREKGHPSTGKGGYTGFLKRQVEQGIITQECADTMQKDYSNKLSLANKLADRTKVKTNKGKHYMHKDNIQKMVLSKEIDIHVNNGWLMGKAQWAKDRNKGTATCLGRKKINNGKLEKLVKQEELDIYLQNGWVLGECKALHAYKCTKMCENS
jgi:hypothetical protein